MLAHLVLKAAVGEFAGHCRRPRTGRTRTRSRNCPLRSNSRRRAGDAGTRSRRSASSTSGAPGNRCTRARFPAVASTIRRGGRRAPASDARDHRAGRGKSQRKRKGSDIVAIGGSPVVNCCSLAIVASYRRAVNYFVDKYLRCIIGAFPAARCMLRRLRSLWGNKSPPVPISSPALYFRTAKSPRSWGKENSPNSYLIASMAITNSAIGSCIR